MAPTHASKKFNIIPDSTELKKGLTELGCQPKLSF